MEAKPPPRPTPTPLSSHHGGQLVYEVVDGVDHELDVFLLRHAVLAVAPQDDVHVAAEQALGHLHGNVPRHVLVLQAVNEAHGARDREGAMQHAVVLGLVQEVHAELVHAFFTVLGRYRPLTFLLELHLGLRGTTLASLKTNACKKKKKNG